MLKTQGLKSMEKLIVEHNNEHIELKKKLKLFGDRASRVSTPEMIAVYEELKKKIGHCFRRFELSKWMPSKSSHGDIDILVLGWPTTVVKQLVYQYLGGERVLEFSKNGYVNSCLYKSESIDKNVHIDFIFTSDENISITRYQYYMLNDFSAIIGYVSKKLHFRYGSEGFFKRFKDVKGNYHNIFITHNLMDGLRYIGYENPEEQLSNIRDYPDIIRFAISSPMFDSRFFIHEKMNQSDRKSMHRPVIEYCINELRHLNITASIKDEDYLFRELNPSKYSEVELEKEKINDQCYIKSNKYNGNWVMNNFDVKQGKIVGIILKSLSDHFGGGKALNNMPEDDIFQYVSGIISSLRSSLHHGQGKWQKQAYRIHLTTLL